jgi:hypothetical protein
MKRSRLVKSIWAAALALSVAATLVLAACGSDAAPTDLPTRITPVPAYSFPAQEPLSADDAKAYASGADGLEFVPWTDIEVTDLGYYDDGGDGLQREHTVGIFEKSSGQLVSDTVVIDGDSELEDGFRYAAITPVVLKGGTTYVLAGSTSAPYDAVVGDPEGMGSAPEVRFTDLLWGASISGEEFVFPRREEHTFYASFRSSSNFKFRTPASPAPAATP